MDTSAVLKEAWAAVENAGLPDKIHEAAFKEALRLIAPLPSAATVQQSGQAGKPGSGLSTGGGAGSNGSAPSGDDQSESAITASENDLLERVATGTGTDLEVLLNLVHLDNGQLRISLPGIKLGKNNADKTRMIARIFTIVRSFGLNEDDTSVELVRDEAQRLKCYDSANFTAQLSKLNGYITKGTGANRRIQAKGPGIAEFPGLMKKLAEES